MSESLTALTVPGKWFDTSVDAPPFDKIIGLATSDGTEVMLPNSPRDYWYGGGYHEGYSKSDITERPLPLSGTPATQLLRFFNHLLLEMGWRDIGRLSERYDCHWLAHWLKGSLDETDTTDFTLEIAEAIIIHGEKSAQPLTDEQIGVIGGLCLSQGEPYAEAHHSFFALNETDALQVTGMHGAVAIATQADTLKYYRETAWASQRIERAGIGLFTTGAFEK